MRNKSKKSSGYANRLNRESFPDQLASGCYNECGVKHYTTSQFSFDGDEQTFMAASVDLGIPDGYKPTSMIVTSEKTKIAKMFLMVSSDKHELRYKCKDMDLWVIVFL